MGPANIKQMPRGGMEAICVPISHGDARKQFTCGTVQIWETMTFTENLLFKTRMDHFFMPNSLITGLSNEAASGVNYVVRLAYPVCQRALSRMRHELLTMFGLSPERLSDQDGTFPDGYWYIVEFDETCCGREKDSSIRLCSNCKLPADDVRTGRCFLELDFRE